MQITKFAGIHNIDPLRSIPDNAQADAVNVDITNNGSLIWRNGFVLSEIVTNILSAWSTHDGIAYLVANCKLNKINADLTLTQLSDCSATQFCDYGQLFFTNDGLMIDGGTLTDLKALAPPVDGPILAATTGDLPPGEYHAYLTISDTAGGKESGTSSISSITLTETGGISASVPYGLSNATIYVSNTTGTAYYSSANVQLFPFYIGANKFPDNTECVEIFMSSLWCSVYIADKNQTILLWSQPKYWQLFNYDKSFLVIPGHVFGLCRTNNGLVVATDEAIYLINDDGERFNLNPLADYGVVAGRPIVRTPDNNALIYSVRGICSVTSNGFSNLTESKFSIPVGTYCSCSIVRQNGIQKLVCLNNGSGEAFNASGDTIITTTINAATVMNIANNAVTRYTGFAFDHIIKVDVNYIGVKSTGLYLLEGITDDGSEIDSYIVTKETDFGTTQSKNVSYVYLDSDTTETITPYIDTVIGTAQSSQFSGRRVRLGRGARGRYWRFKISGIQKLQGIEFMPDLLQRKVK